MQFVAPDQAVLRQHAKEVKFPLDDATKNFICELKDFFTTPESPYGKPAGISAPQVGMSLQIIIIQLPPEAKKLRKNCYDTLPPTVLINPSYTPIPKHGKNKDWEGCYSVPGKMGEVYRYNVIKYKYYTLDGKKVSGVAKGFLARLIQHETGHLNGELYTDLLDDDCRYGDMEEMWKIRREELP